MPASRSTASRKTTEAEIANQQIRVRPINGFIGAEIEGVDLAPAVEPGAVRDRA